MKIIKILLLSVALVFAFVSCANEENQNNSTTPPDTTPQNIHSNYYIEGVSVEDVITFFNEVCLDAEFTDSGDPSLIQKWDVPIMYMLHGEYTDEDIKTLNNFVTWLNTVEGFPGMSVAENIGQANMHIYFTTPQGMLDTLGSNFADMDGGVTFWYENDAIYAANICYLTTIDQITRNSVILEEIYNGLGPVQDTNLRSDSIIYSDFSTPQELSDIDKLILQLLYHPNIKCGMSVEECERAIKDLYY